MIRSFLPRVVRPLRSVIQRLTGFHDLRDRLDRQQARLEELQTLLLQLFEAQQELVRAMAMHEKQSAAPYGDTTLRQILERLTAQQLQLQSTIKASETGILERLTDEIDRLDGYLVFHANELRSALGQVDASSDRDHRELPANLPLMKAG